MEKAKRKAVPVILLALFVIYFIVLFKITVFRNSNSGIQSINLIPLITIAEYLQYILIGNKIIGIANILGNLIIFLPLGYIAALLFPKMRKVKRILVLAIGFSMVIEIFQYVFACGSTDIDDVILNTLGGIMGYRIYVSHSRNLGLKKHTIIMSALMVAFTCTGFLVGNNDNNHENIIQGNVKEISDDGVIIHCAYPTRSRQQEEASSSVIKTGERLEVIFSDDCKITLIEMQQNGNIIEEKTVAKSDIRFDDRILLNQFLSVGDNIYTARYIEVHRFVK